MIKIIKNYFIERNEKLKVDLVALLRFFLSEHWAEKSHHSVSGLSKGFCKILKFICPKL